MLDCGEMITGLLMSPIRGTPCLSDSLPIDPRFFLCQQCGVVLLVGVLNPFVEVDEFFV